MQRNNNLNKQLFKKIKALNVKLDKRYLSGWQTNQCHLDNGNNVFKLIQQILVAYLWVLY